MQVSNLKHAAEEVIREWDNYGPLAAVIEDLREVLASFDNQDCIDTGICQQTGWSICRANAEIVETEVCRLSGTSFSENEKQGS